MEVGKFTILRSVKQCVDDKVTGEEIKNGPISQNC